MKNLVTNLWNQRISKAVQWERDHKTNTPILDRGGIEKDIKVMSNLKRKIKEKSKLNTKKLSKQLKFLESL